MQPKQGLEHTGSFGERRWIIHVNPSAGVSQHNGVVRHHQQVHLSKSCDHLLSERIITLTPVNIVIATVNKRFFFLCERGE